MRLLSEFKEFALKGNMIDLAVGVIIGAAFGGLVTSLVDDMMMPPLGWLMGGLDFKDKAIILAHKGATHPLTGKVMPADVVFSYGRFINATITFVIQAIAVFLIIKAINSMRRKPQPAPDQPTPLTKDQELLMEIRDSLRAEPRGTHA